MVLVRTFGCGSDSLLGSEIKERVRAESELAFMDICLDEHAGEAGQVTKLEAFCDLLLRRQNPTEGGWVG